MSLRDAFFHTVGIAFLALAKTKSLLLGYSSPKPFGISEVERCIEYDVSIVEHWLSHLSRYTHGEYSIIGKNVLELGPGSDLGIGICLLAGGCSQYNACDVNDLMRLTPDSFYDRLFERLREMDTQADLESLRRQLHQARAGEPSRLNYVISDGFDIASVFGESSVDLVFSQAAFEHFDDIESTISQLSKVCKPGAILLADIDLRTHSRWICDKDPNNIYRYPDWLYNAFWFRGIPNRNRPFRYKEALERLDWTDVTITPIRMLDDVDNPCSGMSRMFSEERSQMEYLTIMLCARRSGRQ